MSTYFLPVRENSIAEERSFSAPAPPASLEETPWEIFWVNTFWMPREYTGNRISDGEESQTITRGRVRQGDTFFGLSKSDLAGDKLGFMPLSVRPVHAEQSLSTTSRYTRWTNAWTSTNSAQIYISRRLKLWTIYCIPCCRIFTFLVLGVMLTHLVILWLMFW